MGKVMGFIKGNLVIVISVVLILAFLPTGYVFAGKWNTKVHDEANSAYNKEKRALTSKGSIEYSMPAVLSGEQDLSESRAPNRVVTEFYKAGKAEREKQVDDVVERGTAFNKGDHGGIILGIVPSSPGDKESLLPKSPNDITLKRKGREMAEAIVGTNSTPSVYQRKLQRLNAGSPPEVETLESILEEFKKDQEQRYTDSNADGKVTTAQTEELNKDLVARRLGEYIGRSKDLTFYCSTDAFVSSSGGVIAGGRPGASVDGVEFSEIPSRVPQVSTIDESMVFNWLWDFWVISDVLDAAALANTNPSTGAMAVPSAPVKSIEQISISKVKLASAAVVPDDMGRGGGRGGNDPQMNDAAVATVTGRTGGGAVSAFDLRTIEVVVVASSQDLPKFIDAIGKTNYMTVIDLDIDDVDVWSDLEQGFYYGEDHVVRARIVIESVWLRSWLVPLMPDRVKTALGVPLANMDEFDG